MSRRRRILPWELPLPNTRRNRKRPRKVRLEKEYPTTEDGSNSVRTVPGGGFESNRRRH